MENSNHHLNSSYWPEQKGLVKGYRPSIKTFQSGNCSYLCMYVYQLVCSFFDCVFFVLINYNLCYLITTLWVVLILCRFLWWNQALFHFLVSLSLYRLSCVTVMFWEQNWLHFLALTSLKLWQKKPLLPYQNMRPYWGYSAPNINSIWPDYHVPEVRCSLHVGVVRRNVFTIDVTAVNLTTVGCCSSVWLATVIQLWSVISS